LLPAIAEMSPNFEPTNDDVDVLVSGSPAKRLRGDQDPTTSHDLVAPGMPVQFLRAQ
jgi:hypothetical protein